MSVQDLTVQTVLSTISALKPGSPARTFLVFARDGVG